MLIGLTDLRTSKVHIHPPPSHTHPLYIHIYLITSLAFQNSSYDVYKKLSRKLELTRNTPQQMLALMGESKVAYTGDKTGMDDLKRSNSDCNIVILPETYFASGLGIVLPKGALHRKYFDKV